LVNRDGFDSKERSPYPRTCKIERVFEKSFSVDFTTPVSQKQRQLRRIGSGAIMFSVEGTFQNGVVQLNQPVTGRDGQKVLIVFLPAEKESPIADSVWSDFAQLLQESQVNTGIHDFAHQHDHYLHGIPKREDLAE